MNRTATLLILALVVLAFGGCARDIRDAAYYVVHCAAPPSSLGCS